MEHRPTFVVVAEAAVYRDGRYLFILRAAHQVSTPGVLTWPGGKVEPVDGSTAKGILEAAAAREVLEEAGVIIGPDPQYVLSQAFGPPGYATLVGTIFLCQYLSGEGTADGDEVDDVLWLTPEEALAHPQAGAWLQHDIPAVEERRRALGW